MQNDLIRRSALIEMFEAEGLGDHSLIESVFAAGVYAKIENAPPVEAVEVVHAWWVPNHGSYGTPHCSNCKWRIPYSEDSTLDARSFCPNCGAKMDLQEVETGG